MHRSAAVRNIVVVAALWVFAASASAQPTGAVTTSLTVKGSVEREVSLTVDELKRLPVQHIDDVRSLRSGAEGTTSAASIRRYTGCLLRDVLDRAKPVERGRMDFRRSVVIATASDGYRAVFSWAELYLSPIGEGALVVYERDGAQLDDNEGRIALVSLKDTRPGPRHVKWLQSIELRTLE
jgi:DMSO/TMAO reductase YedYZ molybdopterin-dependent catalytic subunit